MLYAKPGGAAPREVVCDTNGWICNFMRSLVGTDATAYHADWPTIHQDLTARHRWLLKWGDENRERISDDPDWYDPKAAGWWVWGISSWIGHGWCDNAGAASAAATRPYAGATTRRVQMQRRRCRWDRHASLRADAAHDAAGGAGPDRHPHDEPPDEGKAGREPAGRERLPARTQRPPDERGGQGVQQQRVGVPRDGMPRVPMTTAWKRRRLCNGWGGTGAGPSCDHLGEVLTGERLRPWFRALAQRLSRVIVLNRSWESAVTDSVLQQTPSSPKPTVAVFMDPPYKTTGGRSTGLYVGDTAGTSDDVAEASYAWAVEHGDRYRVAYACHVGDFEIPPGWEVETRGFWAP